MNVLRTNKLKTALSILIQLSSSFFHTVAVADTNSEHKANCIIAKATLKETSLVTFYETSFAEGAWDLAILVGDDKHRVTFSLPNQNQTKEFICHYLSLAITQGINDKEQWGWHLAWSDGKTVYYARMDGEAWVSSVPKKIKVHGGYDLHFEQQLNSLTLIWKNADGSYNKMVSDDEGRSWSDIEPH